MMNFFDLLTQGNKSQQKSERFQRHIEEEEQNRQRNRNKHRRQRNSADINFSSYSSYDNENYGSQADFDDLEDVKVIE